MTDCTDLTARIAWLEQQLAQLDGLSWSTDRAELTLRVGAIIDAALAFPNTRIKTDWQGGRLTMCGITTTCTAGFPGAFHNWLNRARTIAAETLEELPE